MKVFEHFIDGAYDNSGDALQTTVCNPATGVVLGSCLSADGETVRRAVRSSSIAGREWGATSVARRVSVIHRFRGLLLDYKDELADLVTTESGKTLADSRGELKRAIEAVESACSVAVFLDGRYSANISTDIDVYAIREPIGISVGVTAFNFPVMLPIWLGALSVAAGNTFICKPSELVPSPALRLSELWLEAGLPAGVWNTVLGDRNTVESLITHPDVAAVSVIGSTAAGRHIYKTASAAGKRAQAFCGAKNHVLVLPDADLDFAAHAITSASFGASGQRCMATSVVVPVTRDIADSLTARLSRLVENLRVGDPRQDVDYGPVISEKARARILDVPKAEGDDGAAFLVDGRNHKVPVGGFYLGPTLVDNVSSTSRLSRDEIFGPVLTTVRADDVDKAIQAVNASGYGNGLSIMTSNGAHARRIIAGVDVGMIGINVPIPVPFSTFGFGGSKDSKFGGSLLNGPEAIHFLTKTKTISARWNAAPSIVNLAMPASG